MVGNLDDQQALAILYDLALTIGGEVNVEPLMVRTMQRLLYHTGFPVGLWLGGAPDGDPSAATVETALQLAIGDYHLIRRKGEVLNLPPVLLAGPPALLDGEELLARVPTRKPQAVALRLPVPDHGVILLLGQVRPAGRLSLPELFTPILNRLSRSLTLCRSYEQEVMHRVERTAYYDPLTGLPNAVSFNNTLQQAVLLAQAKGRWLALVHVDMDDFRGFNEVHGEELGNHALVALGQRLSAQSRPGEFLARIAGDEFMLLFPDLGGWDDVDERIVRILQTNRTPLEVDGQSLDVTFSAGIALLPSDSDNGDTLLRHAQMALHQAKQEGRGHFRLFDAEQDRRTHSRRELLRRLELALTNREFRLYYQPKVDMPSGKVLGFEALLRWFHPDRGMVPPAEFLPMVENSDFIIQLGEWVMREALAQALSWRIAGLETCISVNIAGRHLQLSDFADRVRQALVDVPGSRADNLEIEILESS
ncbi:MAG TPA: diguanylate cyclase, partial [Azospira sp.]|nr:diguanylate cyclase [Azospira sp.]